MQILAALGLENFPMCPKVCHKSSQLKSISLVVTKETSQLVTNQLLGQDLSCCVFKPLQDDSTA